MHELTPLESSRLSALEEVLHRNLDAFYEAGAALAEIREKRLYREMYDTFEAYCDLRWNMTRQRAYQLMSTTQLRQALSTQVDILPVNERQVRALAQAPPAQRDDAWARAVAGANGGQPSASDVALAVDRLAAEAQGALSPAARQELLSAEEGHELRQKGRAIVASDDAERRARDMERLIERIRQARRIAERYGMLALASGLRRWEQKAEGT